MPVINHGTVRGYKLGCRCEDCTKSNRLAKQRERERAREREGKPPLTRDDKSTEPTRPKASPLVEGPGPIEAATRLALAAKPGEPVDPLAEMRREVAYAATRVMDNPKFAPFFKSAADVLRATVADLLAASPAKDGEADALKLIMDSFGGTKRGSRRGTGAPAVDDAAQPS